MGSLEAAGLVLLFAVPVTDTVHSEGPWGFGCLLDERKGEPSQPGCLRWGLWRVGENLWHFRYPGLGGALGLRLRGLGAWLGQGCVPGPGSAPLQGSLAGAEPGLIAVSGLP